MLQPTLPPGGCSLSSSSCILFDVVETGTCSSAVRKLLYYLYNVFIYQYNEPFSFECCYKRGGCPDLHPRSGVCVIVLYSVRYYPAVPRDVSLVEMVEPILGLLKIKVVSAHTHQWTPRYRWSSPPANLSLSFPPSCIESEKVALLFP